MKANIDCVVQTKSKYDRIEVFFKMISNCFVPTEYFLHSFIGANLKLLYVLVYPKKNSTNVLFFVGSALIS